MGGIIGQRWEVYDYNGMIKNKIPKKGEIVVVNNTPQLGTVGLHLIGDGEKTITQLYQYWDSCYVSPEELAAAIETHNVDINSHLITIQDDTISDAMPAINTPIALKSLFQTLRNNIKWLFDKKANIESPTFTGVPKVPNKSIQAVNDGTLLATEAQVKTVADSLAGKAAAADVTALTTRVNSLENLGVFVGSFATKAALPANKSSFANGITINDFATVRADESNEGLTCNYVCTAINSSTGALTWTFDVKFSVDISGKQDKLNRTVSGNDNATGTVSDTGGNLSIPIPVTVAAGTDTSTLPTTATQSLRSWLAVIRNNVSWLIDNRLSKNPAITGATKTKITYDANGLVTGGGDAVLSDIAASSVTPGTTESTTKFSTGAISQNLVTWLQQITQRINGIIQNFSSYVPSTRKVNNKALSSDISLTASDVGLDNVENVAQAPKTAILVSPTSDSAAPAAVSTATAVTGILQTIWNKLLYLFNNKAQTGNGTAAGADSFLTQVQVNASSAPTNTARTLGATNAPAISPAAANITTGFGTASIAARTMQTWLQEIAGKINGLFSMRGAASGLASLDASKKILLSELPDAILGQLVYGGNFAPATGVASLSTNAQSKLGTSNASITLTNNTTAITGYAANLGIYYIATAAGTFAGISFETGDWLISTGAKWEKVDNTDAVTSVAGKTGPVTLVPSDVGLGNVDNVKQAANTQASLAAGTGTETSTPIQNNPTVWGMIQNIWNRIFALNTNVNGKVTANAAITGATKTKITYDSKGLVTAGADLAASDIPESLVPARAKQIPAGGDLNDYQAAQAGYYACALNATAQTIQNRPDGTNVAFTLEVIARSVSAVEAIQRLIPYNSPRTIYQRAITNTNTWTAWYVFRPPGLAGNASVSAYTSLISYLAANGPGIYYLSLDPAAQTDLPGGLTATNYIVDFMANTEGVGVCLIYKRGLTDKIWARSTTTNTVWSSTAAGQWGTFLSSNGGVMTGKLTWNTPAAANTAVGLLRASDGSYGYDIITAYKGNNADGLGVGIGSGGTTIIGGGEARDTVVNNFETIFGSGANLSGERMVVAGDTRIDFITGLQNVADRKIMVLGADGKLSVPGEVSVPSKTTAPANDGTLLATEAQVKTVADSLAGKQPKVIEVTCNTAVDTVAKVVTISGYTLAAGDIIAVTYTNGNTANSATINVNNAGAKEVRLGGGQPTAASASGGHYVAAGNTVLYYYNGTYMCQLGSTDITDANDTSITNLYGANANQYKVRSPAFGGVEAYYPLVGLCEDGTIDKITATSNSTASGARTFTARKIALFRNILYASATTTAWTAGAAYSGSLFSRAAIGTTNWKYAIGQYYNKAGAITGNGTVTDLAQTPLYIGGTRDGGYFTPSEFSLALRDTNKVYKQIGYFTASGNFYLSEDQPVYTRLNNNPYCPLITPVWGTMNFDTWVTTPAMP